MPKQPALPHKTHQLTLQGGAIPSGGMKSNKAPPVKAQSSLTKQGHRFGEKVDAKMKVADWNAACETFTNLMKVKMSQLELLRSGLSGKVVTGTRSEQQSFSRSLRSFKAGSTIEEYTSETN